MLQPKGRARRMQLTIPGGSRGQWRRLLLHQSASSLREADQGGIIYDFSNFQYNFLHHPATRKYLLCFLDFQRGAQFVRHNNPGIFGAYRSQDFSEQQTARFSEKATVFSPFLSGKQRRPRPVGEAFVDIRRLYPAGACGRCV